MLINVVLLFSAIYGCNFCTGGRKAFQALSSNILRVAAINSVGDFVLFLGKVLVVTLTVVSGIYLMQVRLLYTSLYNILSYFSAILSSIRLAEKGRTESSVDSHYHRGDICIPGRALLHIHLRGE